MLLLNVPGPGPDQNLLGLTEIEVKYQLNISSLTDHGQLGDS